MSRILIFIFLFMWMISCSNHTEQVGDLISNSGNYLIRQKTETNSREYKNSISQTYILQPVKEKEIQLQWYVLNQDFPKMWDVAFCDNRGCHLEFPDTCKLEPILAIDNEKKRSLSLLVETNGMKGSGRLEIVLKESTTSFLDTLTYKITTLE